MKDDYIYTPSTTDITIRWRKLYNYIPASEQPFYQNKWKEFRDLVGRTLEDVNPDKPMEVFGREWKNHVTKIEKNWRKKIREEDTIARIGGDEFTVFLTNIPSENFAIDKAKLLISKINEIELKKGNFVGCSVGLAFSTTDKSYDQLFKKADTALYEAKSAGKNIYKVYEK